MADQDLQFIDPLRKEVQLANGPISIASYGDLQVITFTQVSPRVAGATPGVNVSVLDAVVLCRLAVTREVAAQLLALIPAQGIANAPVAGNA